MPGPSGYSTSFGRPVGDSPQTRGDYQRTVRSPDNFPYDKPTSYGTPWSIDADGGGYPDFAPQHPITPKDTNHTPWDDETGELSDESVELDEILCMLGEAGGTPMVLGKPADTGQEPGTIPGTSQSGRWMHDRHVSDREMDYYARGGKRKEPDSLNPWSTAESMMGDGLSPEELELDAVQHDLRLAFDETYEDAMDRGSRDLFTLLADLDPEFSAETFAPDDDSEMQDIYRRWGERMGCYRES